MISQVRQNSGLFFDGGKAWSPTPGQARLGLALVLTLALVLRLLSIGDPWSGLAHDFHSHFGSFPVGEQATRFAAEGLAPTRGMPANWRVELADGTVVADYYAHHPSLFTYLEALSIKIFGVHEWALRLVPLIFSMLSVFGTWWVLGMLWGGRAALIGSLLFAVAPYSAWYGVLTWTESAVICTTLGATSAYIHWFRGGGNKYLGQGALWFVLAGLLDWTGGFILLGLGLHGLLFRKHGMRGSLSLTILPAGFLVAVGIHWAHMRYALPSGQATQDTGATLSFVTTLTTDLSKFLKSQFEYALRFLSGGIFLLFCAGLLRAGLLISKRRLSPEDFLVFSLLVPGVLYVGLFPQRSINHDFFFMLSLPGVVALCASSGVALLTYVPASGRRLVGVLSLTCVLAGGCYQTVQIWRIRRSTQIEELIQADWLAPLIADPDVVILAPIGRGMCLPFYSRAEIIHSVSNPSTFQKHYENVVRGLAPDRPAFLLFDIVTAPQLTSDVLADMIGHPFTDDRQETEARVQKLFDETPPAYLATLIQGTLHPSLVEYHKMLRSRFGSKVFVVGDIGAFELFDLRDELGTQKDGL